MDWVLTVDWLFLFHGVARGLGEEGVCEGKARGEGWEEGRRWGCLSTACETRRGLGTGVQLWFVGHMLGWVGMGHCGYLFIRFEKTRVFAGPMARYTDTEQSLKPALDEAIFPFFSVGRQADGAAHERKIDTNKLRSREG